MPKKKLCRSCIFLLWILFLSPPVCSNEHGNPASDLVNLINDNRTAHKLPKLNNSPGLGCIALQYVELCNKNCTTNDTLQCKPSENDFTEIFAPNCGVELPTFGVITGKIVACRSKYLEPSLAFSDVLIRDKSALSVISNKSYSEVGIGMVGFHGSSFFWCVLFSSGNTNSTFVLENRGHGIEQKRGCFSGNRLPCSEGNRSAVFPGKFVTAMGFLVYYVSVARVCSRHLPL